MDSFILFLILSFLLCPIYSEKNHGESRYLAWISFYVDYNLNLNIDSNHGYNTLVKCCKKVCEGLSSDPLNIAQSLFGKGLISAEVMAEIRTLRSTKMEKGNTLYTAISERVKAYRNRYSDFISVLEENKILHSDLLTTLRNTHFKICKFIALLSLYYIIMCMQAVSQ